MRAVFAVLVLAACGEDGVKIFDPNPLEPDAGVEPTTPDDPPGATPFTVIQDLSGAVGYCGPDSALVDGVPVTTVSCANVGTKPNMLVFDNGGREARCRVGHVPEVDQLAFAPCPVIGTRIELAITPTPNRTDGNYRADILYEAADGTTKTRSSSFYVHRSLDGAAPCPADPANYPTDSRFFAEAAKQFTAPSAESDLLSLLPSWIDPISRKGTLPRAIPFAGASVGAAPFYQLHFKDVTLGAYRKVATVNPQTLATGVRDLGEATEFDVPIWSLRHRIAYNGDRTLVIVRRAFESRQARLREQDPIPGLCTMPIRFGATNHRAVVDCDALVLNAAGEGFCMVFDPETNTIAQAVFSRTMVAKLMRGSTAQDTPESADPGMWGPKRFSQVTGIGSFGPDNVVEFGDAVVLRP